jgi:hypothetical protein
MAKQHSGNMQALLDAVFQHVVRFGVVVQDSEWRHLYELATYCHAKRVKLSADELCSMLKAKGFENAEELSQAYRHIRETRSITRYYWQLRGRRKAAVSQ